MLKTRSTPAPLRRELHAPATAPGQGPIASGIESSNGSSGVAEGRAVTIEDEQFFERTFREYKSTLIRKAQSMMGSREAAEDVVQEVFISTYRFVQEGKYICADSIGGWLFVCTHRQALSALRKQKKAAQTHFEPEDYRLVDPAPEVAEKISLEDRSQAVMDTVAKLPQHQSLAFLLYDVKGFNYEETADQLGVSPNAVRQLLFRARRKIRSELGTEVAGVAAPILRSLLPTQASIDPQLSLPQQIFYNIVRFSNYVQRTIDRLHRVLLPVAASMAMVGVAAATEATFKPAAPSQESAEAQVTSSRDLPFTPGALPSAATDNPLYPPELTAAAAEQALQRTSLLQFIAPLRERSFSRLISNCRPCQLAANGILPGSIRDRIQRRIERRSERRDSRSDRSLRSSDRLPGRDGATATGVGRGSIKGNDSDKESNSGKESGSSSGSGKGSDTGTGSSSDKGSTSGKGSSKGNGSGKVSPGDSTSQPTPGDQVDPGSNIGGGGVGGSLPDATPSPGSGGGSSSPAPGDGIGGSLPGKN